MDTRTPEQRRRIMQSVKSKHTGPELAVRRLLHRMGYRYRLHRKDLPGKPDIAFISLRKAIFVHGCFWHGHGCPRGACPSRGSITGNPRLTKTGSVIEQKKNKCVRWDGHLLVIWQCETVDLGALADRLQDFVGNRETRSTSSVERARIAPNGNEKRASAP